MGGGGNGGGPGPWEAALPADGRDGGQARATAAALGRSWLPLLRAGAQQVAEQVQESVTVQLLEKRAQHRFPGFWGNRWGNRSFCALQPVILKVFRT